MHVLFYVEPLTEREDPTMKRAWLHYVRQMVMSLRRAHAKVEVHCIVGDGLESDARSGLEDVEVSCIWHTELVPRFGRSALAVAGHWYAGGTPQSIAEMAALVRERSGGFAPTVCLTFSPAPFLAAAFAEAPTVHFELGIVSRAPFPVTGYLDNRGGFKTSTPYLAHESIARFEPSSEARAMVQGICDDALGFIKARNPFTRLMLESRAGHENVVLVALQSSRHYAYQAHADFQEPYDLLLNTLKAVAPSTLVVATEHPLYPVLSRSTLDYLRRRFPNLLFDDAFRELPAASQYLMEFCQAVVTVNSSVGLQAMIWDRPLVVAGQSHLAPYAASSVLGDLPRVLSGEIAPPAPGAVLAWNLTRYSIPFDLLFEGGVFPKRLEAAILCHRERRPETFFDDDFAPLPEIAGAYRSALSAAMTAAVSPAPAAGTPEGRVIQLFVDDGLGWNTRRCLTLPLGQAGVEHFSFDLSGFERIDRLRLDPANDLCALRLRTMELWTTDGTHDLRGVCESNGLLTPDGEHLFPTVDPQLIAACPRASSASSSWLSLEVQIEYTALGPDALARFAAKAVATSAALADGSGEAASSLDTMVGALSREVQARLDAFADELHRHGEALDRGTASLEGERAQAARLVSAADGVSETSRFLDLAVSELRQGVQARLDDLMADLRRHGEVVVEGMQALGRERALADRLAEEQEQAARERRAWLERAQAQASDWQSERDGLLSQASGLQAAAAADAERLRWLQDQLARAEGENRSTQQALADQAAAHAREREELTGRLKVAAAAALAASEAHAQALDAARERHAADLRRASVELTEAESRWQAETARQHAEAKAEQARSRHQLAHMLRLTRRIVREKVEVIGALQAAMVQQQQAHAADRVALIEEWGERSQAQAARFEQRLDDARRALADLAVERQTLQEQVDVLRRFKAEAIESDARQRQATAVLERSLAEMAQQLAQVRAAEAGLRQRLRGVLAEAAHAQANVGRALRQEADQLKRLHDAAWPPGQALPAVPGRLARDVRQARG